MTLVSVLMVTYGAQEWVARAIDALEANTDPDDYELVIVDNGGPDASTSDYLTTRFGIGVERAPGRARVVLHRAPHNLGFGAGNNLAANLATTPTLCLLNSDAIVPPGWLPPLLAALDDPSVGAVVPMLCELDGTVQEAGANVEPDGRVDAFGRGDDPDDPAYHWVHRVPYGSAACMVVRTRDFRAIGGFDCGFGLGYYEDVDLACELLRREMYTVLVPSVRVVHARGASVPDTAVSLERARRNQARFVARQWPLLADRWHTLDPQAQSHRVTAARDATAPRRVLVVDADPMPSMTHHDLTTFASDPASTKVGAETLTDVADAVRGRRFHYDTIVASSSWLSEHAPLLDLEQPAATRVVSDAGR